MSIENELKKNTAAVEANTAALLGGANGITAQPTTAAAPTQPVVPAPAAQVMPGPGVAQAAPVVTQPPQVALAPVVAQPMTHEQAQAELGVIVQALGPADTRVQATMVQYGSARLTDIPAENLFSLVQACKVLLTA